MKQTNTVQKITSPVEDVFFKHQDIHSSFTRFKPLNDKQAEVFRLSKDKNIRIIGLFGSAGTGKTALGLNLSIQDYIDNNCDQIKFIRNAVAARKIGALPGEEWEKDAPYIKVCKDLVNSMFDKPGAFASLSNNRNGVIDAGCATFLQGETWTRCSVVVDEPQNMNWDELYMIMTRLGEGSKLFLCGDTKQCMLNGKHDYGALPKLISRLKRMKSAAIVEFEIADIVRDDIVAEFLIADEELSQEEMEQMHYDNNSL